MPAALQKLQPVSVFAGPVSKTCWHLKSGNLHRLLQGMHCSVSGLTCPTPWPSAPALAAAARCCASHCWLPGEAAAGVEELGSGICTSALHLQMTVAGLMRSVAYGVFKW